MALGTAQYTQQISNVSLIYNIYRTLLPLVLLITYISSPNNTILGTLDQTLFVQVTTGYAVFGVLLLYISGLRHKLTENHQFLTATLIIDILAMTLLIYSCKGIVSGLGLLLIVTIASGSIMIRGRISTFLAAVASIAVIYSEVYLSFIVNDSPPQFVQAGILGTILFAASMYIQTVTNRAYRAALLADEQASNIVDLEKLNKEIIQRMRTGIIVVGSDNQIVTINSAALAMLQPIMDTVVDSAEGQYFLPEILVLQLSGWRSRPQARLELIEIPGVNIKVQASFAYLNREPDSDILVFLENQSQIMQRVQQMKLASLGRLTASIAHEVRNPLGAISHASQLLSESESIGDADHRMLEIILNHCKRVNQIIEHVLNVSRHKELVPNRIQLNQWLVGFIHNYRETHPECDSISLSVVPEVIEIKVITSQLEQVLNNLFDNGLRYSKKATGKATLVLKAGLIESAQLQQPFLQVIDQGRALDQNSRAQLFEPFHTTEPSGTGLGLYISKELCEANQAQLVYSSTPENTSCFSIYFSHPDRVET
jgi:two-component system, NtrC family, sensor histidine kinase PilS